MVSLHTLKQALVELDKSIQDHKEEIKFLEKRKDKVRKILEGQCLSQYGSHKDDGGMFYGNCKRCGAFLG